MRGLEGRVVKSFPSTEAILEAVADRRVSSGYVISTRGPWLAEKRWPGQLVFLPCSTSVDSFAICAAVRKTDPDLKDAIDRAWEKLDRSGSSRRCMPAGAFRISPGQHAMRRKSNDREETGNTDRPVSQRRLPWRGTRCCHSGRGRGHICRRLPSCAHGSNRTQR